MLLLTEFVTKSRVSTTVGGMKTFFRKCALTGSQDLGNGALLVQGWKKSRMTDATRWSCSSVNSG